MKNQVWKLFLFMIALTTIIACKGTPESIYQTLPIKQETPAPLSDRATSTPDKTTPTEAILTQTLTPTSALITATHISTKTPQQPFRVDFNSLSLEVSGKLWVYDGDYWMIDFDEQHVNWMAPSPPKECWWEPYTNSLKLLCSSPSEIYLYDLISKQKQDLPLKEFLPHIWGVPHWPDQLIYSISGSNGITETIYSYNFITQETKQWGSLPNLGFGIPFPSADGQHWVAKGRGTVVEFDLKSGLVYTITSNSPAVTSTYAWSPTDSKFIYGASDLRPEVTDYSNYVYLLDMDTYKTTLIEGLPDGIFDEDEWPVWSPDGKKVAIIVRPVVKPALCILTVETLDVNCLYREEPEDKMNYFLGGIAWSPSGDVLAFIENRGGDTSNLILYSPESGTINVLIEDGHSGWLFWR